MQAIQDIAFKDGTCFGCGPVNPHGLRIKSFWSDDGKFVIATFQPRPELNAGIPNVLYGGTVASLIDCHSNWTAIAATYRMEGRELDSEPHIHSVTASLHVDYLKPTPMDQPVHLKAWVEGEVGRKTRVICELGTAEIITARGDSIFARVDPKRFGVAG
jgi:acyl-coenzyme A thioesterase PaaI-like protein